MLATGLRVIIDEPSASSTTTRSSTRSQVSPPACLKVFGEVFTCADDTADPTSCDPLSSLFTQPIVASIGHLDRRYDRSVIGTPMAAGRHREDLRERLMGVLAAVVVDPDHGLERAVAAPDGVILEELVELSRRNRVDGSLAIALRRQGLEVPPELELACRRASLVHLRTSRALGSVAAALGERGIRWAVVKGPAVARLWPEGSLTRTYDDLDILVSPCDLRDASDALQRLGFAHRNRNWSGFIELGVAEIPLDDGSVVIDLHWNLVALSAQRRDLHLDTSALLERATTVELSGCSAPVLCDLDAFTHLCCHSGLAGARNLRMLRDVHLSAARVDPDEALRALRDAGCERLAAPVLDRAVRMFGPVVSPDGSSSDALRLCGHQPWIHLNRLVDRIWPVSSRRRRHTFSGMILEAGRPRAGSTARALTERLLVHSRSRLGLRTPTSEGGALHWETDCDPDQVAGIERYLRYVRHTGRCDGVTASMESDEHRGQREPDL